jgi:hypothetical protein
MSSFPTINGPGGIDNFQADFNSLSARALAYIQANVGLTPPVVLTNTNPAQIPFSLVGAAAQSANYFQIRDSGANIRAFIDASGHIQSGAGTNPGAVRVDQGDGANSFVALVQTGDKSGLFRSGRDHFVYYNTSTGDTVIDRVFTSGNVDIRMQGTTVARFDASAVAGQTRMLVYDVDNGTLERVTVGAADSGGAGFKVLRIPN